MARNRNRGLQSNNRQEMARKENEEQANTLTPDMILQPGNEPLINAQIVQILIQNNHPDQVKALMEADLDYNSRRLEIVRKHAEEHPDAKENRRVVTFRRIQYITLLCLLPPLLIAAPFVSFAVAATFGMIAILIISGVLLKHSCKFTFNFRVGWILGESVKISGNQVFRPNRWSNLILHECLSTRAKLHETIS